MTNKKNLPEERHWLDRLLDENGMVRTHGKPRHAHDGGPLIDANGKRWEPLSGGSHYTDGEPLTKGVPYSELEGPLMREAVDAETP